MLKMGYQSGRLSIAKSVPTVEPVGLKRFNISLLIETTLVTIAAILAIRLLAASFISRATWLVSPGILVAAALIPTAIRRYDFPKIGLNIKQISPTILVVCRTCIVFFSALFAGLWLLKIFGFGLPLRPVHPKGQGWISWLFYQSMYVAVAEEVFFRGYAQGGNILKMINPGKDVRHHPREVVKYSTIGCLFCSCSYHSSGQNSSAPYISAWLGSWLALYPDKVAVSTDFIPRFG